MKATLRIPTEQYAFVEIETEVETPADAITQYRELSKFYKGGTGLPDKEFHFILDKYLWGDGLITTDENKSADEYLQAMNEDQQFLLQAIKRSRKRWNYKLSNNIEK